MSTTTDDTLTLKVHNTVLSGWSHIRVTRWSERLPSDFEL